MGRLKRHRQEVTGEDLFIGIDLHKAKWHVTVRSLDMELFCGSIPGELESLRRFLDRYEGNRIRVVYEAGCLGLWLHDRLVKYGVDCLVTPPSLVPQEYRNQVKTNRRDSR